MITIAVANQKGGVGKTTISFNLAQILSNKKRITVLAVDNDPQGNLTSSFLEKTEDLAGNISDAYDEKPLRPIKISNSLYLLGSDINLAPIAEREFQVIFRLKEGLERLVAEYPKRFDYVVIDCLPSFGHLQLAALNAADYVLIPIKPAPYALVGLKDLFNTVKKIRKYFNPKLKPLGIVINQADGRNPIIEREMEAALLETYGDLVLKSRIRKRIKLVESSALQSPISEYDPNGPSAAEFKVLANEIIARLKNKDGKQI
jgi:chromosome partitioning protein